MSPEELLERLVAFPTVAGRSNVELIEWVSGYLGDVDHAVLPAHRPDAANLHAVVGPRDQPGVLLSAHTDVVDVAGQAWSGDPFVLRRLDGRLYGRGTADMKGFLAAALAVVPYAAQRGLRRPLHLALSADEELGCRGVPALLDALEGVPLSWCLVGEPTELGVAVRHKGKAGARVTVRGRASHSSTPWRGVNAVAYAARLITALTDRGLNVGPIRGGMVLNVVPDECVFEVEARTFDDPEATLAAALREAVPLVAPPVEIEVEPLAAYPALAPCAGADLVELVAGMADGDRDLALDFGTEAGLYHERLGVPVVVCGPGSMSQGHEPDEYIAVEQLDRAERFLRRLVDSLASA